jgi:hypothetical protein
VRHGADLPRAVRRQDGERRGSGGAVGGAMSARHGAAKEVVDRWSRCIVQFII